MALENVIAQIARSNPLAPAMAVQQALGRQRLMQAQTAAALSSAALQEAKVRDPFLAQSLTGPAGEFFSLQRVISKYGADSPEAKAVTRAYNAKVRLEETKGDYYESHHFLKNLPVVTKEQFVAEWQQNNADRKALGQPTLTFKDYYDAYIDHKIPAAQRVTTPPAPGSLEPVTNSPEVPLDEIGKPHAVNAPPTFTQSSLNPPAGMRQVTPEEAKLGVLDPTVSPVDYQKAAMQTQQALQKQTTDTKTRGLALQIHVLNNLLNTVDPSAFTYYTGPQGQARLARDKALTLAGHTVPQYKAFKVFTHTFVPMISDQIRMAFGTSVQTQLFNVLKRVVNPIAWDMTPEMALAAWNSLRSIISHQAHIYQQGLEGPVRATDDESKRQEVGRQQPVAPRAAIAPSQAIAPTKPSRLAKTAKSVLGAILGVDL